MKKRHSSVNPIVRTGMAATSVILLFFLFGKAAMVLPWQEAAAGAWEHAKFGLASLTAMVWKQSYPALGIQPEKSRESSGKIPWYIDFIWNCHPVYYYYTGQMSGQKTKHDSRRVEDPSYENYLQNRDFYEEHQYLFQYGGEDTNLQTAPIPAQISLPVHMAGVSLEAVGRQYVMAQLADYDFLMKHFYSVHPSTTASRDLMNAETFLSKDFKLKGGNDAPQILIYHTHSQEAYRDYGPDHPDGTVIGLGNRLTEYLQQKGYQVIHDTTVYDLKNGSLDRNKAYTYALAGITAILQQNPSVEVILDLHRDGVNEGVHMVSNVNGRQTAPIMFFNGTSQTPTGPIEYLTNPYREDNLAFSLQMQLNAEAYFPGLTRKIYLKGLRYNLHLRPRSALIEVGAQTNTTEEAMNAMEPLSELLDMILQGK